MAFRGYVCIFLAVQLAISPAVVSAQEPTRDSSCDGGRCDNPVGRLGAEVAAAHSTLTDPCLFLEPGTVPEEYAAEIEKANAQLRAVDQAIWTSTDFNTLEYRRGEVRKAHGILQGIKRKLDADLRAAGNDCAKFANTQAALASYYLGPLRTFAAKYNYWFRGTADGYSSLYQLYVRPPAQTVGRLSGPWRAVLDPVSIAGDRPLLRFNPFVEQVIDTQTRAGKSADEQRYLESLQLRIAATELANYATLDGMLDDGGQAPCIPKALSDKFMSLREPERIIENRRWLDREGAYRPQLIQSAQEAMAGLAPLASTQLFEAMRTSDPWVEEFFTDNVIDDVVALENQIAPQILANLVAQEGSLFSSLTPEQRHQKMAELATQSRAAVVTQYVDSVLKAWSEQEAAQEDAENKEKLWRDYNTPEKRAERLAAIKDAMRVDAVAIGNGLTVPDVPALEFGQNRSLFAQGVTNVALAAADLEDKAALVSSGVPTREETRISPRNSWAILVEDLMDQYPVLEDQVPDGFFRSITPFMDEKFQTRYGEEGEQAVQRLAQLIASGKPLAEARLEHLIQLSETDNEEVRRQLRALGLRIGLDGIQEPTMERVLSARDQKSEVFIQQMQDVIRTLPIVSQTVRWDGETFLGMDWANPDTEATLFNLVQSAAQDRIPYYRVTRGGRLLIDRAKVAEYIPADQVDRVVRDMQRIADEKNSVGGQQFVNALGERRDAFRQLDVANNTYIADLNPDYSGMAMGMGATYTIPDWQNRMTELRNAVAGSDMDRVRERVQAYWTDYTGSSAYGPHRSLAHTLQTVVNRATQGEELTEQQLQYLRDHIKRQRENWPRTIRYAKDANRRAAAGLESLANQDSVNANLFNWWDGDPIDPRARGILRDFAKERRAEIPKQYEQIDELGKNVLQSLETLLNDKERLGQYSSLNEALMQELPIGDLAETGAGLRRTAGAADIPSYVLDAERNLEDVTKELIARNETMAEVHQNVRDRLQEGIVEAGIREAKKDICRTLENLAEQEDVEDLRKNLMVAAVRQAVLAEFPEFATIDQDSEHAYLNHEHKWQTVSHVATMIVISALVVVLIGSYFVPGLNVLTASATPYLAGGVGTLFAVEFASGTRNTLLYNDRMRFAEDLGTGTHDGLMLMDVAAEGPMSAAGLRSARNGEAMWTSLDLLFVFLEAGRLVKWFRVGRYAEGMNRYAEWGKTRGQPVDPREIPEATRLVLQELGIKHNEQITEKTLRAAFRKWAQIHHPDKFAGEAAKLATVKMQALQNAMAKFKIAWVNPVPPPPAGGPLLLTGPPRD